MTEICLLSSFFKLIFIAPLLEPSAYSIDETTYRKKKSDKISYDKSPDREEMEASQGREQTDISYEVGGFSQEDRALGRSDTHRTD